MSDSSTVNDIIIALGEKLEPISGQPSYDQLFAIRGAITHALYPVPFDEELGVHKLCGIVMDPSTYKTRFFHDFPKYSAPKAFTAEMEEQDEVKRAKANIVNKAKKADWKTFSAASNAVRTLLLDLFDTTWLVALEDEVSGFAEVSPDAFFTHLLANCTGRHAVDSLALFNSVQDIHLDCNSIADYVKELHQAQKASVRIDPTNKITDANLLRFAINAVIGNDRFATANDTWEDLVSAEKTWSKWQSVYLQADQRANVRKPRDDKDGSALGAFQRPQWKHVPSATAPLVGDPMPTLDVLTTGFDNLANAATTDKAVLETLVETNRQLTTTNATLTATNERLTKELAQFKRQNGRQSGGAEKKLCPHCKKYVAHAPEDCFELEENADKRPKGWRLRAST